MNLIVNKIIELRKKQGLTQEELAEKSNVNLRTIQRMENNQNEPRGNTLKLICKALEIDITELAENNIMDKRKNTGARIIEWLFLLILNFILMGIIGFLTLDSNANWNSLFGGILVSILLPFFIVYWTQKMTGTERLVKFGLGYLFYFLFIYYLHGFIIGFKTGLFPCLFLSLTVLYFGEKLIKRKTNVAK
ncbi:helix-turn-helix domain-containing protein [Robertkochia solimangrovi]|uniref:helix-turn-helix domain-containing protein n=1 Tax=Robertkochia solimangrovi TaxID=2213046 RepID=UPI00117C97A4|nr:helix-turn-helix transcriptional regulator [Robertkochia solimangrovi]TRZ42460.1 hypothetical protein DMZ48_13190 [Robertkochia solimangrovi]